MCCLLFPGLDVHTDEVDTELVSGKEQSYFHASLPSQ